MVRNRNPNGNLWRGVRGQGSHWLASGGQSIWCGIVQISLESRYPTSNNQIVRNLFGHSECTATAFMRLQSQPSFR